MHCISTQYATNILTNYTHIVHCLSTLYAKIQCPTDICHNQRTYICHHVYLYVYACMCLSICVSIRAYLCIYPCITHICHYGHLYVYACMCVSVYLSVLSTLLCVCVCIYVSMYLCIYVSNTKHLIRHLAALISHTL